MYHITSHCPLSYQNYGTLKKKRYYKIDKKKCNKLIQKLRRTLLKLCVVRHFIQATLFRMMYEYVRCVCMNSYE